MTATIKPSECPNYTIINDPVYGLYLKEDFHLWTQVHPAENELPYVVSDNGFEDLDGLASNVVTAKSDEIFFEFEIKSLPIGWRLPKKPRESPFDWWPIPGHPNHLLRSDGLKIRNKVESARRAKGPDKSGYFVLYTSGVPAYWPLSALGNSEQIKQFLETGEVNG